MARALPEAWTIAGPDAALAARADGARAACSGRSVTSTRRPSARPQTSPPSAARTAAPDGRALYAANAALPWPSDPIDVLWHAATLLREHRGDGHVALLTANGLSGRECNVFQSAAGNVPRSMIERARYYDDAEWHAVVGQLADRRPYDGRRRAHRRRRRPARAARGRTDDLALAGYVGLDDAALARLIELLTPIAAAVVAAGDIPAATPMGPTLGA